MGLMTDIRDAVEEACRGTLSRGACEDGVFERLRFQNAGRAGGIGLEGPPRGMCSQVAFPGARLVDASRNKHAQTHKGPRV